MDGGAIIKVAEAVAEAGPKLLEATNKLFPGISERSKTNSASHSISSTINDMNAVMHWGEQMGISDEMLTSLANMVFEKHESDQRIAECLMLAAPHIVEDDDPYDVDSEWLDCWRVHASRAHVEDVQQIWGAVLAGEINKPGAISKRTMSILADMGKSEADAFVRVAALTVSFTVTDGSIECMPFLLTGDNMISCGAIEAGDIPMLMALGLLEETRPIRLDEHYTAVSFGRCQYSLTKHTGTIVTPLNLADKVFSLYGRQLASVTSIDPHPALLDYLIRYLPPRGADVVAN